MKHNFPPLHFLFSRGNRASKDFVRYLSLCFSFFLINSEIFYPQLYSQLIYWSHASWQSIHFVCVWAPRPRFSVHRFLLFFFLAAFVDFGRQYLLLWTVHILFTYCAYTVYVLKNIKNGSHDTIYIFKNYFATVFQFSVFSFQQQ